MKFGAVNYILYINFGSGYPLQYLSRLFRDPPFALLQSGLSATIRLPISSYKIVQQVHFTLSLASEDTGHKALPLSPTLQSLT